MTIQQAIEKAIEGGYPERYFGLSIAGTGKYLDSSTLLTPLFWQSLGKAMGFEELMNCAVCGNGIGIDSDEKFEPGWKHCWHRFIDHLAEGKDAESFFENL